MRFNVLQILGSSSITPKRNFSARPRGGVRIVSVPLGKCLHRNSDVQGDRIVAPNSVRIVDTNAKVFRDRFGSDNRRRLSFLRV